MNNDTMNQNMAIINELNKVEGFNPAQFLRNLAAEGESAKWYLDVVYRKLWFRLRYPEGKIVKTILKLTEQFAVVEAKVYLHRSDPADNFIANATAQRYFIPNDPIGEKYVELAETAAVGRALMDAGFGLQFPDQDGLQDPAVVDAPISGNQFSGNGSNAPQLSQTSQVPQNMSQAGERQMRSAGNTADWNPDNVKALPVDQIYSMLDRYKAEAVVCPFGRYKNKTLGAIALERPDTLFWIRDQYNGPDNLIRAAAAYLLDAAQAA